MQKPKTWRDYALNNKALAIIRRSSHRQEDNSSAEVQEEEIRKFCDFLGLKLVRLESIIESAKDANNRPKYNALKNWAVDNKVSHIVFYMMDRDTRNFTDMEINANLIKKSDIVFHYAKDLKTLDKYNIDSEFLSTSVNTLTNKDLSMKISIKVNDSMDAKARSGWFPNNHAPLGYMHLHPTDEAGREKKRGTIIVPDKDERKVRLVQSEFALKAEGYSLEMIRTKNLEMGLVPVEMKHRYSRHGIEDRLKNPFYWGQFRWKGEIYDGKHELIIPAEILRKVKSLEGKSNAGRKGKHTGSGFFSGGWIRCGHPECGLMLTYDPKTKNKGEANEKVHHYYRCANSRGIHRPLTYVKEAEMFEQFESALESIVIPRQWVDELVAEFEKYQDGSKQKLKNEFALLRERLGKVELKEEQNFDLLGDGIITQEEFKGRKQKLSAEREQLQIEIEKYTLKSHDNLAMTAKRVFELAINAKDLWKKGTPEERRKVLELLCSNPTLEGSTVRYDLKKPFAVLAEMAQKENWRSQGDLNPCILREREVS